MPKGRLVGVNERGRRIGADHHKAKFDDATVELIRELHEAGLGYDRIRAKFDDGGPVPSKSHIARIVRFENRCQAPVAWIRVNKSMV